MPSPVVTATVHAVYVIPHHSQREGHTQHVGVPSSLSDVTTSRDWHRLTTSCIDVCYKPEGPTPTTTYFGVALVFTRACWYHDGRTSCVRLPGGGPTGAAVSTRRWRCWEEGLCGAARIGSCLAETDARPGNRPVYTSFSSSESNSAPNVNGKTRRSFGRLVITAGPRLQQLAVQSASVPWP